MATKYIDAAGYFLKNAGGDRKLSWEEIKDNPIKVLDKKGKVVETVKVTKKAFDEAQDGRAEYCQADFLKKLHPLNRLSISCDLDPNRLTYNEFSMLAYEVTKESTDIDFIEFHHPRTKLKNCKKGKAHKKAVRLLRDPQIKYFANGIIKEWAPIKKSIETAIEQGKFPDTMKTLYQFVAAILLSSACGVGVPEVDMLCRLPACCMALLGNQEFASKEAMKNSTIKQFWSDVTSLLDQLLNKAEEAKIGKKKLIKILRDTRALDDGGGYEYEYGPSITLWKLLKKVNPGLEKRIKKWK
jgi:hypothetical protein